MHIRFADAVVGVYHDHVYLLNNLCFAQKLSPTQQPEIEPRPGPSKCWGEE